MNNKEIFDYFFENNIEIANLIWIAASSDTHELETMIEDIENLEDLKEVFTDIDFFKNSEYFLKKTDEIIFDIIDNDKLGFLAEVLVKERYCYDFDEEEKPTSYLINPAISKILYCYGDTLEALINQIYIKSSEIIKSFEESELEKYISLKKFLNNIE